MGRRGGQKPQGGGGDDTKILGKLAGFVCCPFLYFSRGEGPLFLGFLRGWAGARRKKGGGTKNGGGGGDSSTTGGGEKKWWGKGGKGKTKKRREEAEGTKHKRCRKQSSSYPAHPRCLFGEEGEGVGGDGSGGGPVFFPQGLRGKQENLRPSFGFPFCGGGLGATQRKKKRRGWGGGGLPTGREKEKKTGTPGHIKNWGARGASLWGGPLRNMSDFSHTPLARGGPHPGGWGGGRGKNVGFSTVAKGVRKLQIRRVLGLGGGGPKTKLGRFRMDGCGSKVFYRVFFFPRNARPFPQKKTAGGGKKKRKKPAMGGGGEPPPLGCKSFHIPSQKICPPGGAGRGGGL